MLEAVGKNPYFVAIKGEWGSFVNPAWCNFQGIAGSWCEKCYADLSKEGANKCHFERRSLLRRGKRILQASKNKQEN